MPNPYGQFVADPLAPSGYRWKRHDEPEPTGMLPVVRSAGVEQSAQLPAVEHEDEGHVDPDEFPAFDGVTSLMIRSIGAPE